VLEALAEIAFMPQFLPMHCLSTSSCTILFTSA
jgi:hypothetical protein